MNKYKDWKAEACIAKLRDGRKASVARVGEDVQKGMRSEELQVYCKD